MLLDMLCVKPDRRTWEWAVVGRDETYGGKEKVDVDVVPQSSKEKQEGTLFPGLTSLF
jgi:hypothetical protein